MPPRKKTTRKRTSPKTMTAREVQSLIVTIWKRREPILLKTLIQSVSEEVVLDGTTSPAIEKRLAALEKAATDMQQGLLGLNNWVKNRLAPPVQQQPMDPAEIERGMSQLLDGGSNESAGVDDLGKGPG